MIKNTTVKVLSQYTYDTIYICQFLWEIITNFELTLPFYLFNSNFKIKCHQLFLITINCHKILPLSHQTFLHICSWFFSFFFWLGFYDPSRLFHSFWAKSIISRGENGGSQRKPPDHLQAEFGMSRMWPKIGLNPQRWVQLIKSFSFHASKKCCLQRQL